METAAILICNGQRDFAVLRQSADVGSAALVKLTSSMALLPCESYRDVI